jgi:hypothetical protein
MHAHLYLIDGSAAATTPPTAGEHKVDMEAASFTAHSIRHVQNAPLHGLVPCTDWRRCQRKWRRRTQFPDPFDEENKHRYFCTSGHGRMHTAFWHIRLIYGRIRVQCVGQSKACSCSLPARVHPRDSIPMQASHAASRPNNNCNDCSWTWSCIMLICLTVQTTLRAGIVA